MKKTLILTLAAVLLCACGGKTKGLIEDKTGNSSSGQRIYQDSRYEGYTVMEEDGSAYELTTISAMLRFAQKQTEEMSLVEKLGDPDETWKTLMALPAYDQFLGLFGESLYDILEKQISFGKDEKTGGLIVHKGVWEKKTDSKVGIYYEIKLRNRQGTDSSFIIIAQTAVQYDDLFDAQADIEPVQLQKVKEITFTDEAPDEVLADHKPSSGFSDLDELFGYDDYSEDEYPESADYPDGVY